MQKKDVDNLRDIDFLGRNFVEKTKEIVKHAKKEEKKAKESEKRALRVKRQTQELMNKIIPREIVSQLNHSISVQPQLYKNVTICVLSIVDYEGILSKGDSIQVHMFCTAL